jgi:hypothetical protein
VLTVRAFAVSTSSHLTRGNAHALGTPPAVASDLIIRRAVERPFDLDLSRIFLAARAGA